VQQPFQFPIPEIDLVAIAPIVLVVLTGILALITEMVGTRGDSRPTIWVSLVGLGVALAAAIYQLGLVSYDTFNNMVERDTFTSGIQIAVILATGLTVLFSDGYMRQKQIGYGEFYPLILWSAAGAMIMSSTQSLLMIFVGLEILSISIYVLAGMSRSEEKSEESALKYFLLGGFASGFLLYGIAFIYGATGSLQLASVESVLSLHPSPPNILLVLGLGLLLVGLGFKLSLVPFHLWTPDVYQGAPTNVTAFMASVSKIAAFAALYRILESFALLQSIWLPALTAIGFLTMTYGNLVALRQSDVKRMLGYSSISNAGYLLVAVIAKGVLPRAISSTTVIFYLLAYALTTIGAFAVLTLATRNGTEGTKFSDLRGLYRRSPAAAIILTLLAASLMGFPGTAGFVGKLFIVRDGLQAGLNFLVITLAVNSVISVYYYLGLVKAVFATGDDQTDARLSPFTGGVAVASAACAIGVIGAGVLTGPVLALIGGAHS
jgi:NADH-quinone oxidoreductase subunit N